MVLEVRRSERELVREFVSELRLAISEQRLAALEEASEEALLLDQAMPSSDTHLELQQSSLPAQKSRQKV